MANSDVLIGTLAAILVAVILFISAIISTVFGAFAGWVISLTFLGDWLISGFKVFGFDVTNKLPMIGALFGFLAGFFKSSPVK